MNHMIIGNKNGQAGMTKLSSMELMEIHGGTAPTQTKENDFSYSVEQAPGGSSAVQLGYARRFSDKFQAGINLTRQGNQTSGSLNLGGRFGQSSTWSAGVSRIGNETRANVSGHIFF